MSIDPTADFSAAISHDAVAAPKALALDADRYIEELSDLDISDDEKRELLVTLWQIMRTFVQLGVSTDLSATMLRQAGLLPLEAESEEGD